jgi:hypothetical protein
VLRLLFDYGEFVYDGESIGRDDRIHEVPDRLIDLLALRRLVAVSQHASLDWVISDASMAEAAAMGDTQNLQWLHEVAEYARHCLQTHGWAHGRVVRLAEGGYGYLAQSDGQLLEDALELGCDGFLTIDRRLWRNREHLGRQAEMRLLTPIESWDEGERWSALLA